MKTGLVFGVALGVVATTAIMNNEAKLMKMYKKGKKNMMHKIEEITNM